MKKISKYFLLALVTAASSAHADFTAAMFKKYQNGTQLEKESLEMYVGGVGKGYMWANTFSTHAGQAPLFCYQGDYNTAQFRDIASAAVAEHFKARPTDGDAPVEMLLFIRLKQMHPCTP